MMHPPRFLDPVLQRPGDDSPRLRYANWLDGCGNPLGEFIRLQCLLARTPVGRPHLDFERREQELLSDFQRDWSDFLRDRVDWCSFRRGFVEEIALSDRQLIRHGRDLFRAAPVVDIHLKSDGKRLHELPEAAEIGHTIFLDLSAQRLGDECMEALADAPFLKHVHGLNLASVSIGDDGLDSLCHSPHLTRLRELYLNDNPITDDGIRSFVLSPIAERLEVLDLRDTHISSEGFDILRRVRN